MSPDRIAELRIQFPEAADIVQAAVDYVRASDAMDLSARKIMAPRERQQVRADEEKHLYALQQAVRGKKAVKQEGLFGG
jgi:hypothetical protein